MSAVAGIQTSFQGPYPSFEQPQTPACSKPCTPPLFPQPHQPGILSGYNCTPWPSATPLQVLGDLSRHTPLGLPRRLPNPYRDYTPPMETPSSRLSDHGRSSRRLPQPPVDA